MKARRDVERVRERLAGLIEAHGTNATDLSRRTGRSKDYVRDFLDGRKESIAVDVAAQIEREFQLAPGELWADEDNPGEPQGDEGRVARHQLAPGEVAERDVTAGLGSGGIGRTVMVDGQEVDGVRAVWRLPVDYLHTELRAREGDVDFIAVDGDSMVPTLLPGDRVMVNTRQTAPSPDGLYAIFDGIGIAVKRLEVVKGSNPIRIRIISDNPAHGTDEIAAEDLSVIGRVICKVTRL